MNKNEYAAPNISTQELWSMGAKEFNLWRQKHDFPRIVKFFHDKLPLLSKWMDEQKITDKHLIEHGPARFIRPLEVIFLYELEDDENNKIELLDFEHYDIGYKIAVNHKSHKIVSIKQKIIPYLKWGRGQRECVDKHIESHFFINGYGPERKRYLFTELELLDAGNIELPYRYNFGERNLEFVNIDNSTFAHRDHG